MAHERRKFNMLNILCTHYKCICIYLPKSKPPPPAPPSPPFQLLNLQECAEVISLKWPLLFLILIWFQKSQIIETILNVYSVHLLCRIMILCDFHLRHISWHAFDTPCCFARQKSRMLDTKAILILLTKWQWRMLLKERFGSKAEPVDLTTARLPWTDDK